MQKEFFTLLEDNNKSINDEVVAVTFNSNSIDIMDILEDGSNGYGHKFYSVYEAYDYLQSAGALE